VSFGNIDYNTNILIVDYHFTVYTSADVISLFEWDTSVCCLKELLSHFFLTGYVILFFDCWRHACEWWVSVNYFWFRSERYCFSIGLIRVANYTELLFLYSPKLTQAWVIRLSSSGFTFLPVLGTVTVSQDCTGNTNCESRLYWEL